MDNITISRLMKKNPVTKKYFGGVYASNKLPRIIKCLTPQLFIINVDPSYKPGSHWICIALISNGKKKSYYFDSYGLPPVKLEFVKFMKKRYQYSKKQLQHPFSTTCGQWCMFFAYKMCKGRKNFKTIFQKFSKNLRANDNKVNLWVEKTFQTDQDVTDEAFVIKQISRVMNKNKFKKLRKL